MNIKLKYFQADVIKKDVCYVIGPNSVIRFSPTVFDFANF